MQCSEPRKLHSNEFAIRLRDMKADVLLIISHALG